VIEGQGKKKKSSPPLEVQVRTMKSILEEERIKRKAEKTPQQRTEERPVTPHNDVPYNMNPSAGKSEVDKSATSETTPPAVAKRPFDDVPSIPRPPIPVNEAREISKAAGRQIHVTPDTDAAKLRKAPMNFPNREVEIRNWEGDSKSSGKVEEDLANQIMKHNSMMTNEELLAVSPGVRKALLRKIRNSQVHKTSVLKFLKEIGEVDELDSREAENDEHASWYHKELQGVDYVVRIEDLPSEEVFFVSEGESRVPPGVIVQRDVVDVYQQELPPEDRGKVIVVASASDGLRSVYPKINDTAEIESILDGGSQIVAMELMIAVGLGLTWDPDTVIHMQSANGQLKRTKGLARNVPFDFGDLKVYLQIHVIDNVPYQVLLGRPFDVLTEAQVQNFADGYQEMTIKCPNTGARSTIGTYPRGQGKKIQERKEHYELKDQTRPVAPQLTSEKADKENSKPQTPNILRNVNFQSTLMN
jgi:hypothetical protein